MKRNEKQKLNLISIKLSSIRIDLLEKVVLNIWNDNIMPNNSIDCDQLSNEEILIQFRRIFLIQPDLLELIVREDKNDRPWPKNLRLGGGSKGIALLKDVPIFYELWRNINGFPPEFYVPETKATTTKK